MLCLRSEIARFKIKTCVLIPDYFRTEIISPRNYVHGERNIPDYEEGNKWADDSRSTMHMNQPGDPAVAAKKIVDAVRSEGEAEGKELPEVLLLGEDCVEAARKRCKYMLAMCDEWEEFANCAKKPGEV